LPELPGATVCMALVPLPKSTWLLANAVAPVPPLATATVPLTFPAFPVIFPVTLLPATVAILASVTAASAKSTVAILPSKILAEFIAPEAMAGEEADPVKSPVSWILPLFELLASVFCASTYVFTAL
jgi:hypothetical protein